MICRTSAADSLGTQADPLPLRDHPPLGVLLDALTRELRRHSAGAQFLLMAELVERLWATRS